MTRTWTPRALSVRQPWAWAILHAGKDVENRSWATGYRGELLIHAGKTIEDDAVDIVAGLADREVPGRELWTGGVVGRGVEMTCAGPGSPRRAVVAESPSGDG